MEPKKEGQSQSEEDSIFELFGEITDFQNESNEEESKIEKLRVQRGDFVEKYFNHKLKFILKSGEAFQTFIDLEEVHNDFILSLNYILLKESNNPEIDRATAINIIAKIDKDLKNEIAIQIDSLLPLITGKELLSFFDAIKDYSFPQENKIDQNKYYTIIVESTFSLYSQIIDKVNQLRKSFLLFSLINDLYLKYPKYVINYYRYFIARYILQKKVEKKNFDASYITEKEFSFYGNYIFIIASNKTLKKFHETKDIVEVMTFNKGESPDNIIKKSFREDKTLVPTELSKTLEEKKKSINIPKDPLMKKAFKEMNYLILNINNKDNYCAKMIFLDTYLNLITPKCVLYEKLKDIKKENKENAIKLEKMNKRIAELEGKSQELEGKSQEMDKLKKTNKVLIEFIKLKFPDFDFSKVEEIDI